MTGKISNTAIGVFTTQQDADAAIAALHLAGFTSSEIGIVSRDVRAEKKTDRRTSEEEGEDAGEGALVGAVTGAGIGGLVGAGVLTGMIPVIGPALFAGTLGVLASNAAGGAAIAGIVGALVGWGVPREDAEYYQSEVSSGRVVVTVNSIGRYDEARAILRSHGATSRDPVYATSVNG